MDLAYFHIVLNHLPIMGIPIGLGLLLLGIVTRNDSIKRAAFLVFVVLGILTVPVFLTGKGGEDFVEDLPGVSEAAIQSHESMAVFALVAVLLLAAFSLFAFLKYRGTVLFNRNFSDEEKLLSGNLPSGVRSAIPGWVILTALVLAVGTSAVLGLTGKLGGKIRHVEFYGGAAAEEEEKRGGRNRRTGANTANQPVPAEEDVPESENDADSGKNRRGRDRRN